MENEIKTETEFEKLLLDKEEKLKPRLTDEFLETVVEGAKIFGWSGDHHETRYFINQLYRWAGKEPPTEEELVPYGQEYLDNLYK